MFDMGLKYGILAQRFQGLRTSRSGSFKTETRRHGGEPMIFEELSKKIIGAAIEVHRVMGGPGLLESMFNLSSDDGT